MANVYPETAEPAVPTPPLDGDARADVVVVGGGITGLSTALHLAERGVKAVLLEAHEPGWGASGRNGGQVNPGLKHDPDTVERDFGVDLGRRMNALAGGAPAFVFDLIKRHANSLRSAAKRHPARCRRGEARRGNPHIRRATDSPRRAGRIPGARGAGPRHRHRALSCRDARSARRRLEPPGLRARSGARGHRRRRARCMAAPALSA